MAWVTNLPINMDNREDPTPISIHLHRRMAEFRHRKPDWWPENESWPPTGPHWRRHARALFPPDGLPAWYWSTCWPFLFFVVVLGTVPEQPGHYPHISPPTWVGRTGRHRLLDIRIRFADLGRAGTAAYVPPRLATCWKPPAALPKGIILRVCQSGVRRRCAPWCALSMAWLHGCN